MISKRRFSLPRLILRECGYFPWVSGFISSPVFLQQTLDGFFSGGADCGHPCVFGAYQVLDAWIARVSREERRHWKPGNRP